MREWDELIRQLADEPDEYQREGGTVLFTRHGQEYLLTLRDVAGVGLAVVMQDETLVPLPTFIQRDMLELPRLAAQVCRALEKAQSRRPAPFIDGPAELDTARGVSNWPAGSRHIADYLIELEPGTTRVLQLMAGAGKGKTVLLENTAIDFAKAYSPDPHPTPLLLPVDLLGRYVGTIDDAIAGSLNNTYLFPRLSQRDIIACMASKWLILALDGFDELVARVGVRDAFRRINELLDQLNGNGTIILSARESFFELYHITSGIRTYLQPRTGSYSTAVLKLCDWTEDQGRMVFTRLGSQQADQELSDLMQTFDQDRAIVLHPFFLTRLADLWRKGERFTEASGQPDRHARMAYVIETFITRESSEKWVDRDQNPLLDIRGHSEMLGGIAEEMWRTGAFTLDVEELRVVAEIALSDSGLPAATIPQILERLPTHAALLMRARGLLSFVHDRFLHYFLAYRLEKLLRQRNPVVKEILSSRELPPEVMDWLVWKFRATPDSVSSLVAFLNSLAAGTKEDDSATENLALIAARLLADVAPDQECRLVNLTFVGEALACATYVNLGFENCRFWHVDLSASKFQNCTFTGCKFGDVRVIKGASFAGSVFAQCTFASLEGVGALTRFSPEDVARGLESLGAKVLQPARPPEPAPATAAIPDGFVECLEAFVRASEKTCDFAVEEVSTEGRAGNLIARIGTETGVLRDVKKQVGGPKRRFLRFGVDRDKLLRGQVGTTGDERIDAFWKAVRTHFARRR